ncbi:MAG: FAD-dependent oxidoreductase [Dehalococcoidia bacterium]|nr:MAG: FAD-dependent oxidoreductase [Dehalococcoidia bacterium]
MSTINLEINGKPVSVNEGITVLEAARDAGIKIPTLCYHEALSPYGGCRLCTVEITARGRTRMVTSCTYPVEEGLVVTTDSPAVHKVRKMIIELLLARCPDVPILQSLAKEYGVETLRLKKTKHDDCILCGLCVRMCAERMGTSAISFVGRGVDRRVDTPFHVQSDVCRTCGACAFVCPTGAIKLEDITDNTPIPIPSEFDTRLGNRAPIYIPYPQAIPNVPIIDSSKCIHLLTGECKVCESFCKVGAINHGQQDEVVEIEVGSIILTPGFEPFDATIKSEYGYGRMPNVVTSLEFERILSASGPFQGQVLRPSDARHPVKIAWIQCVGSRDETCGRDYCSSVCCMYATKEAIIAKEHASEIEPTIFYNDIRAHGKGFERYYESAKNKFGVRYVKGIVSGIKELQQSKNLILEYSGEEGQKVQEEFEMVVLSVGLVPSASSKDLAEKLSVDIDRFGFCETDELSPNITSRPGIYVAGAFDSPMDIPESVMHASSAACLASQGIAEARGTMVAEKEYPPETDVTGEEPRVGVFVCRCGTNIARVVDVPSVAEYAKSLPNVVYAEEYLYTCSTDTQIKIMDIIKEHNLNRIVVASCSPRTHEPLFQETIREAGLNKFLFEMANIRDQCSWVHATHAQEASEKAKDLVRMAVARVVNLEPLHESPSNIIRKALVIGGGLAGMTAALGIASQGFEAVLVEREGELGGNLRHLYYTLEGQDPQELLSSLMAQIEQEPMIRVYKGAEVSALSGYVGNYETTIKMADGNTERIEHGVVILATGGVEYTPTEYLCGQSEKVMTQVELEERIAKNTLNAKDLKSVVMIQCVGSREEDHMYCSRICCSQAVKNAIKIKDENPDAEVYVLYRDIRTYSMKELKYREARDRGVTFIRFDVERKPEVELVDGRLQVKVFDSILGTDILLQPDILALSAAVRPQPDAMDFSSKLKLPLTQDGFYMEAHLKLRPLDFVNEGMYLCGLAHAPKTISESISQARGAVSRAVTVLSKTHLMVGGVVSVVDEDRCVACLTCVRSCPFNVPRINERGVASIEPAACQGCGICASACPRKAIRLRHYSDDQVMAKTAVLCEE